MLLLPDALIDARRAAVRGLLSPLADSLAADLEPALASVHTVPTEKALLSRTGGRCETDGTTLVFDPFSPKAHRCAACGAVWTGDLHDRAWLYPYQLWLAERALQAALLHLLRGDQRHLEFAARILTQYADAYASYPNRDNVLGPARVFFSTYLESIWLLQICVAAECLDRAGDAHTAGVVHDGIVGPASAIIGQYNEGASNRQVWNNTALMAAALLASDRKAAEGIVNGPSGLNAHLTYGLLPDGTWYEGENYHLFAHRGLWYCITMAESAGIEISAKLRQRFNEGFATPFATALPDFTFPSRKDSQYAVSLRQWRVAEHCELGIARCDDPRLRNALGRLYESDVPPGETGRARSTADAERHQPPVRLSRADLGWRALLHALPSLPTLAGATQPSAHLPQQGLTVFRRGTARVYAALDWGQSGGGHGHPDRLNLVFAADRSRWLDDLGTGSYVDPSLHWYRSTLAHNAPLVNGQSQIRTNGRLLAHEERGGVGWVLAEANVAPGVRVQRALVATPDYFVDEVRWDADRPIRFELPIHFTASASTLTLAPAVLDGSDGLEDGFNFVAGASVAPVPSGTVVPLSAELNGEVARAWVIPDQDAQWYQATGPGQPATLSRQFHVVRCQGTHGRIRSVWAWSPRVEGVVNAGDAIEVRLTEAQHFHQRTPNYWQMDLHAGSAKSGIELFGWNRSAGNAAEPATPAPAPEASVPTTLVRGAPPITIPLGGDHYRRSEEIWIEAGCPRATVTLGATGNVLHLHVSAGANPFKYGPRSDENPYDNEHVDIHFPGVQVYVRTLRGAGAWLVRPVAGERGTTVRDLQWGDVKLARTQGRLHAFNYELWLDIALPTPVGGTDAPFAIDVLVNDAPPNRWRRRGQLVMSGAHGEFVYLRGDRHDPDRLVPFVITD